MNDADNSRAQLLGGRTDLWRAECIPAHLIKTTADTILLTRVSDLRQSAR